MIVRAPLNLITGLTKRYRVVGVLKGTYECECESCDGHTVRHKVDAAVIAFDPDDAARSLCAEWEATNPDNASDADWVRGPVVTEEEIPEDEKMRAWAMPTLPGLEDEP